MGWRCVIVDDNPRFLEASSRLLEREGIRVLATAGTKRECLELVSALAPDIVLLDISLGDEDGFEVCRRLSLAAGGPQVILISTQPESECVEPARASGAVGFLPKERLCRREIEALLVGSRTGATNR